MRDLRPLPGDDPMSAREQYQIDYPKSVLTPQEFLSLLHSWGGTADLTDANREAAEALEMDGIVAIRYVPPRMSPRYRPDRHIFAPQGRTIIRLIEE